MTELRSLAEHCNFGPTLDAMIQDRVVCGINDDAIQKRLLAEGDKLTLAKVLSLAQSYETAVKDAATLSPNDTQQIHRVNAATAAGQTHSKKPYYICTGKDTHQVVAVFAKSIVTTITK